MVIQHNIPALNSHRNLGINNSATAKNLEKLSSGYRINRAGDDAAGLAISEKMRGQIRGLGMAEQNASHGINLIQTAEGGLNETHSILQRMRELAVQSSNATYQNEDRAQIEKEFQALKSEIDRIATSTHYNGIKVLDGTTGGTMLRYAQQIGISTNAMADLGVTVNALNLAANTGTITGATIGGTLGTLFTGDETDLGFNQFSGISTATGTQGNAVLATVGGNSFTYEIKLTKDNSAAGWAASIVSENSASATTATYTSSVAYNAAGDLTITVTDGSSNSDTFIFAIGQYSGAAIPGDPVSGGGIDSGTIEFQIDFDTNAGGAYSANAGITNETFNNVRFTDGTAGTAVTDYDLDMDFTYNKTTGQWDISNAVLTLRGAANAQAILSTLDIPTSTTSVDSSTDAVLQFVNADGSFIAVTIDKAAIGAPATTVGGDPVGALDSASFSYSYKHTGTVSAASREKGVFVNPNPPVLTENQVLANRMLTQLGLDASSALSLEADFVALYNNADAYLQTRQVSDDPADGYQLVLQVGSDTYVGRQVGNDVEFWLDRLDENGNDDSVHAATLSDATIRNISSNGTVSFNIRVDSTAGATFGDASAAITAIRGSMIATETESSLQFQIGANGAADQRVGLFVANMSSMNIGLIDEQGKTDYVFNLSVADRDDANYAIDVLNGAIIQVAGQRAELGALQNRLEHTLNNLGVTKENLTAAESTIRDVDMAKEMMEFTKNNILVQAAQAMLAQANQLPQGVLSLLR